MILAIRTDSMVAELYLLQDSGEEIAKDIWEAGRSLAKDLLSHIETLVSVSGSWPEVLGIVVFRGPGSFTSLRIGITTANTIAYANSIPVIGEMDEGWNAKGVQRLLDNENDQMVLPEYGADPHITAPKK